MTTLYIYATKGTSFDIGTLVPRYARRHNTLSDDLLDGDAIGVVWAHSHEARQILEANGIVVLPAMHRVLPLEHIKLFAYAGAKAGDTTYDLAEKLYTKHGMFWFHPEWSP